MTVASILTNKGTDVVTVPADLPVIDVIRLLDEKRIGAVPVIEGGRVVGVFSERDVVAGIAADGVEVLQRPVSALMSSPAMTVQRDEPVIGALSLITRRRIRHLPVVENDVLLGMVSIGDLVKFRIERIEAEAAAMRDYILTA